MGTRCLLPAGINQFPYQKASQWQETEMVPEPLPGEAQQTTAPQMTEFRFSPDCRSRLCQVASSWVTSGK